MALPHAQPLDVIDIRPLGNALPKAVTTSLLKTPALQLVRLVLPAGHSMPEHSLVGAVTVQCIEGESVVSTATRQISVNAGQLVVLNGGVPHAVRAVTDSSLLVTILF